MAIMLTGGGSGGHITPLLAVAREIKKKSPGSQLHYIGEKGSKFSSLLNGNEDIIAETSFVFAGKFRRYHGESWFNRITDIKTILLNLRDCLFALIGLLQSLYLLLTKRPEIIFIKGGYVGLPVGLAARILRVPYITHDSDAVAGLSNRLIGKGAVVNAVGIKGGYYSYPKDKIYEVGIPCREGFKKFKPQKISRTKRKLNLPENDKVLLITGGSQGARKINEHMIKIIPSIFDNNQNITIVHQIGKGNDDQYGAYNHPRLRKLEFIDHLEEYSGVADLIITRAGASTLAEYARQEKACIVIPSPYLAGGHQLRNADALKKADAAVILSEKQISNHKSTQEIIEKLLPDDSGRAKLGKNLSNIMTSDAASNLANIILEYKSQ